MENSFPAKKMKEKQKKTRKSARARERERETEKRERESARRMLKTYEEEQVTKLSKARSFSVRPVVNRN